LKIIKNFLKKHSIILIVIITSISLAGIVAMQLFWVKNAWRMQEQQLDHRVSIAMKSVINQLVSEKGDTTKSDALCNPGCGYSNDIIFLIEPQRLDSVIKEEFENLHICHHFKYGIYKKPENVFLMGDYKNYENEIISSSHYTTLSCLVKQNCYMLGIFIPGEEEHIFHNMLWWLVLSVVFLLIVIISFSYVIINLLRQKKLSEMKTDFVNNMTHEFKTPIATISLASEMLLKPGVNESPEKTMKYANVIYDENSRLKNQVEQVLQIAVLDKGVLKLKKREIDIHEIIGEAVESIDIIVKQRNGEIKLSLDATHFKINADPVHFLNIIINLLDNANKFSQETPEITVKTWNVNNGIKISVEDKGIGISSENQKHIFKKFYRVHTGNIHDVKGFGLGLYYVKTIVDAHSGRIDIHSEQKKYTRFELFFPFS